ncbi:MAG: TIGR01777 family oxidoreductase [Myxococcales bacterium]|nr:TIGR01777 family oxidoreductase [Myxococcales bacterium]
MPTYRLSTVIPTSTAAELFRWHARPGAFHRLNPPWDPVEVVERTGSGLEVGVRLTLRARVGPASVQWVSEHTACDEPHGFTDEQQSGPFRSWTHHHRFTDGPEGEAGLTDEIHWEAPLGAVGAAVGGVQGRLERTFAFRHRRTADDLSRHAPYRERPRLRVLITGASGLIGRQLTAFLDAAGHEVVAYRRGQTQDVSGFDAVVHLAGAPISDPRWDDDGKKLILDSRVKTTQTLVEQLLAASEPPRVVVSGSAVGWYGDAGDGVCAEEAPAGDTFLAAVCRAWEAAAQPVAEAGIRLVTLRTGIVLSAAGGFLGSMLPMFRTGMGGPVGSGQQFLPWIHLDDHVALIHEILQNDAFEGPVNATAPQPVRQRRFATTLGRALGRPALAPAPAFAVRAALGRDKADELVLQGQRAVPARAQELGFRWVHPDLLPALRFELGRT